MFFYTLGQETCRVVIICSVVLSNHLLQISLIRWVVHRLDLPWAGTVQYSTVLYSTVVRSPLGWNWLCTRLHPSLGALQPCTDWNCTVLCCTALHCIVHCTVLYCTMLAGTVLYSTVLYCTVLYCTGLYCTGWNWFPLLHSKLCPLSTADLADLTRRTVRYGGGGGG